MPEGDTIFRTATTLRRWLAGREVTSAHGRVRGLPVERIVGRRVDAVEAHGKHLLMRFAGGAVLHTHMRMTGSWHVYPTGEPWGRPERQARMVLEAGGRLAVCFNAPVVELLTERQAERHPALRHLGPDALVADGLTPVVILGRVAQRARAAPTAGELLLDQQVVAGIGNVYRCESLFLCGIHPAMPVASLTDVVVLELVLTAARLMHANAASNADAGPGSAFARSLDGPPGRSWVYRRSGRPCRRCGTTVRSAPQGFQARQVYWCPSCQPGPTPSTPA